MAIREDVLWERVEAGRQGDGLKPITALESADAKQL